MADEERVEPTLDVNGGIPPPPVVEQHIEVEEEKPKSKKMLPKPCIMRY